MLSNKYSSLCLYHRYYTGAVLEGFLRFPETTQDFPSMMGAAPVRPFSATTFYEAYTAG